MKYQTKIIGLLVALGLVGCSNAGSEFAAKAQTLAECTLAGNANCTSTLDSGSQIKVESDSLFYTLDSARISTNISGERACYAFGDKAGRAKNTKVVINTYVVKMYGDERPGALEKACKESGTYEVSLTVAKQS